MTRMKKQHASKRPIGTAPGDFWAGADPLGQGTDAAPAAKAKGVPKETNIDKDLEGREPLTDTGGPIHTTKKDQRDRGETEEQGQVRGRRPEAM